VDNLLNQKKLLLAANKLKILAHPIRLEIIQFIGINSFSVTQIYHYLKIPQAIVSQHLALLRNHEILKTNRDGQSIFYSVNNPHFLKILDVISQCEITKTSKKEVK
jgi:DNA-binding transcriptional ArsR family regulator